VRVVLTLSFDQSAVAAEARHAEDAGYDGVSVGEHLFFHGPHPNGFIALAAAAGATTRVRLLSSLTVLPLYPAALAPSSRRPSTRSPEGGSTWAWASVASTPRSSSPPAWR